MAPLASLLVGASQRRFPFFYKRVPSCNLAPPPCSSMFHHSFMLRCLVVFRCSFVLCGFVVFCRSSMLHCFVVLCCFMVLCYSSMLCYFAMFHHSFVLHYSAMRYRVSLFLHDSLLYCILSFFHAHYILVPMCFIGPWCFIVFLCFIIFLCFVACHVLLLLDAMLFPCPSTFLPLVALMFFCPCQYSSPSFFLNCIQDLTFNVRVWDEA